MRSETEMGVDFAAPVRRFQLRVIAGAEEGKRYAGTRERTLIGTAEGADLRLSDPTVSREHCEIVLADGKVLIRDLQSRNGTFVNGVSVMAAHLTNGTIVKLGRTELAFDSGRADTAVARVDMDRFGLLVGQSK